MVARPRKTTSKRIKTRQPAISFYRNIAVSFLLVTVVLLVVVAYMSVKKVTIKVIAQSQTIEAQALVRVGAQAQDMPHISGVTGRVELELDDTFTPTGTQEKEVAATGLVTIKNETNKNQPLVATTRLLSPEGVLFRLKEFVTVPAGGQVSAEVYADKAGGIGEVGPTRFIIPGLWEPLQTKIYAISDVPTSGGIQKVGAVSAEDIAAAKETLEQQILTKTEEQLRTKDGSGEAMDFVGELVALRFESDVQVGEEVASFDMNLKATVIGALYDGQQIAQVVNKRLQDKVLREPVSLRVGAEKPELSVEGHDPGGTWVQLLATHSGMAYLTTDSPALDVLKFYGKSKEEIEIYVQGIEGVSGVNVRFRPAWSTVAPRVPEHIDVKVVSE